MPANGRTLAMGIPWHSILFQRWVIMDVAVLGVLWLVQLLAWISPRTLDETKAPKESSATRVSTGSGACITGVGILLPLSLVAVQLVAGSDKPSAPVMEDVFVAAIWFALSLVCGLFVQFFTALEVEKNPLNLRRVGVPFGWQLISLAVGVGRLLAGIAALVSRSL
jgi:hypothetical protein